MKIRESAEIIKYRLRVEAGVTVADLAFSMGRNPSTISLVINGLRKSEPVINEIARLLGEDPEELASYLSPPKSEND